MSKVWLIALLSLAAHAHAQQPLPAPDVNQTGTGGVLLEMASRAGVIFCGQVTAVVRHDDAGFVEVQFRVDQPVKGSPGAAYVLREWTGVFPAHADRLAVGRNLLMLLTAPGPSGMSSPLDGGDGAIPIVAGAAAPDAATQDALAQAPDTLVDLRWIAARVERTVTPARDPVALSPWIGAVSPIDSTGGLIVNPALPIVMHLLLGGV